ncbi:hypothetical protein QGM71_01865 [Virgibacillus sp. C22-A2]|uniref:DUF4190 domain-containing protein n=1 Tax=Virgibacillus tibetensis TaxID=3042313 RepID=A0ABU6KCQ4_9BACI|nr:hypothetical protein [Virgibacillus sp. C22-A2]
MDEFQNYKDNGVETPPNHGEHRKNQDFVGIEPDSSRNEEYAAELTADDYDAELTENDTNANTDTDVNSTFGWIGIALSVISFFMMPIILGGAGIILGFVSRRRGADTLGNIAIAAGAISILITLFVLPFV